MNELTRTQFQQWLDSYGRASAENNPQASADLFAPDARYYETPFADPMVGRDAIFQYLDRGAQRLKDKTSIFEILSVQDQRGIAFSIVSHFKSLP